MKDFGSQVKTVGGNEGGKCKYPTRLDTYGCDCAHDCSYCYAKSLLDFRGLWNPKSPSIGDISKISREIKKLNKGEVVRLGGMTDCFQPVEKLHRVTYKTIRLLNKRKAPYLIVTKSAIIADDEYLDILDKSLAHIQITTTTLDDAYAKTYEKASPPSQRVDAIRRLQDAGFDVAIRLSPYIPGNFDIQELKGFGIKKACVEFLRVNSWIKQWFDVDYSAYTVSHGGYLHMPLSQKIGYIEELKDCFEQITVCEDEDVAYNYWKEHINFNQDDCCNLRR